MWHSSQIRSAPEAPQVAHVKPSFPRKNKRPGSLIPTSSSLSPSSKAIANVCFATWTDVTVPKKYPEGIPRVSLKANATL
jgi:hypothetical protein